MCVSMCVVIIQSNMNIMHVHSDMQEIQQRIMQSVEMQNAASYSVQQVCA